jgi:sortase (surface protein transpeptidase)
MTRRGGPRPAWSMGGAVLLLALVTGASSASGAVRPAGRLPASWTEDVAPGIEVLPGLADEASAASAVRPVLLRIPAIEVDARVVPVGVRGTEVSLPRRDNRVGWYRNGAAPGAPQGTAVLLGHVRTASGPGPFASLGRLEPGDGVRVDGEDGTTTEFRVVARRHYHKDDLPASTLFAPDQRPLLVLITCGGPVEGRHYRDNVVVVAEPV